MMVVGGRVWVEDRGKKQVKEGWVCDTVLL